MRIFENHGVKFVTNHYGERDDNRGDDKSYPPAKKNFWFDIFRLCIVGEEEAVE